MKKTMILISLFFLLLFCSSTSLGNFGVQPRELSITMKDEFISGNTLKTIKIINTNNYEINISWYLDHPSLDLIRPNKTTIPKLSWIDLKPQWELIPAKGSAVFYIFLDIPEEMQNLNKNWESWIVFKQNAQQFFNIENAVRFYIDTPNEMTFEQDQDSDALSISIGDQFKIPFLDLAIAVIVITLLLLSIIYLKKKRRI